MVRSTRGLIGTAAIAALVALGTWVRLDGLDTHFSHGDDGGVASWILSRDRPDDPPLRVYLDKVVTIPTIWTYAPLQYLVTPLLLSRDQSYRQVLLWGRFPSFLAGAASLVLMARFLRRLHGEEALPHQLLGVALLAFSWEHVIYAQQMSSFAIGVTATLILLDLLVRHLRDPRPSLGRMALLGLLLGVLACAQYQVMFFFPGLFLALLVARGRATGDWRGALVGLSLAGAIALAFVVPLWFAFIRDVPLKAGYIHWNAGTDGAFAFALPGDAGVFGKVAYAIRFFLVDTWVVIENTVAFTRENGVPFRVAGALATALVVIGCVGLATAADPVKRHLALFLGVTILAWMALIVMRRLTLGPTRHVLVLLPLFAVTITEGLALLWRKLGGARAASGLAVSAAVAAILVAGGFLASAPGIRAERRDAFDESWVLRTLREQEVAAVFAYGYTYNLSLMRIVRDGLLAGNELERWPPRDQAAAIRHLPPGNVALVGHRGPVPAPIDELLRVAGYRPIFSREVASDTEVDFSTRTRNGTNGLFFYVYGRGP